MRKFNDTSLPVSFVARNSDGKVDEYDFALLMANWE